MSTVHPSLSRRQAVAYGEREVIESAVNQRWADEDASAIVRVLE